MGINRLLKGVCASIVLLAAISSSAVASSTWGAVTRYDDIRKEYRDIAQVIRDDGRYFGIYQVRGTEGVWVFFGLPASSPNRLSDANLPVMRTDKGGVMDPTDIAVLGLGSSYFISAKTALFRFDNADSLIRGVGFLYNLVSDNSIKVRYWTEDRDVHEVEFSLAGSMNAIATALNISDLPSYMVAKDRRALHGHVADFHDYCTRNFSPDLEGAPSPSEGALEICFGWVQACETIAASNPDSFGACFSEHRRIAGQCIDYSTDDATKSLRECTAVQNAIAFPDHEPYQILSNTTSD